MTQPTKHKHYTKHAKRSRPVKYKARKSKIFIPVLVSEIQTAAFTAVPQVLAHVSYSLFA